MVCGAAEHVSRPAGKAGFLSVARCSLVENSNGQDECSAGLF